MKILTCLLIFFVAPVFSGAQEILTSWLYPWEEIPEIKLLSGKEQTILKGSTAIFSQLEVVVTTVHEKKSSIQKHPGHEEMVIVKEGILNATLNGITSKVPAGGIILVCPGDELIVRADSEGTAVYYIFRWKSSNLPPSEKANRKSEVYQWDYFRFISTEKGGRRNILQRPTAQLNELEIHTTLLKEGLTSHAAHTHPDDEFILVKAGTVEETINGKSYTAGTGSLFFLSGKDNHGIRNAGKGECEYYAIRFK